jgi:hypothetical protein
MGRVEICPASRSMARTMAPGTRQRETVNGITVELLGIPHGGGWRSRGLEHLAYIVELGGRRVLHVGDAELTDEVLAPFPSRYGSHRRRAASDLASDERGVASGDRSVDPTASDRRHPRRRG